MSGVATLLDVRRSGLYRDAIVANYLNHEEVRLAIGAPPGDDISACNSSIPWIMTNDIMKGYAQDVWRVPCAYRSILWGYIIIKCVLTNLTILTHFSTESDRWCSRSHSRFAFSRPIRR